jgi:hypothetical protein
MRELLTIVLCSFSIIFCNAQTSTNTTDVCDYYKDIFEQSPVEGVNVKSLRKQAVNGITNEIANSAIALYSSLKSLNDNSISPKKREEMIRETVSEFIAPAAKTGHFNAIAVWSKDYNVPSYYTLELLSKSSDVNPVRKYMLFQMYVSANSHPSKDWRNDAMINDYLNQFATKDLLTLRDTLNARISLIIETKGEKGSDEIRTPGFCQSMAKGKVYSYTGIEMGVEPVRYLKYLLNRINFKCKDIDPLALAQTLIALKRYELIEGKYDYLSPEKQWFKSDATYAPIIYKLLSSLYDHNDPSAETISSKSYYLNAAARYDETDAYYNLACLFQHHYQTTENQSYNDSCLKYLEKAILRKNAGAYTLKAFKVFNGDGYKANKSEGVALMKTAMGLGDSTAIKLLKLYPETLFSGKREGYYYRESIKIREPWDLLLRCSNGCGKYTYPSKIYFGYRYEQRGTPQIKGTLSKLDQYYNPVLSFTPDDFYKTTGIAYMGFEYWKSLMCSEACRKSHENLNNQNWESASKKRIAFDNEVIKCFSCQKSVKRGDMISISECSCLTSEGEAMNVGFGASLDIYGSTEPKVCSSQCFDNFCSQKCKEKKLIKK